jgi:hypothetical protein
MRKYPKYPWKEDKIKCVVLLKNVDDKGKKIEKQMLKVFVTRDADRELASDVIERSLPIEQRFKYNISPFMKISIPRKVFGQVLKNNFVSTYFYTATKGDANLISQDRRSGIRKELWHDPNNKPFYLYFKRGLFIKAEIC